MSCCDCLPDEGCADCDPALARLRDGIAMTQAVELLTRATLDIETGERQFDGTFAHLTIEDCDAISALLKKLQSALAGVAGSVDKRISDRRASLHYAAILYAITSTHPEMPVDERAALADAINRCQIERGLVE